MDLETLLFEVRDGIALITLNRPERLNAMNRAMLRDIQSALDRVEADDAIRDTALRPFRFPASIKARRSSRLSFPPLRENFWSLTR